MQEMLARARNFSEPLLLNTILDTGENAWVHAQAVADLLANIGGSEAMQAASYLVYACEHLNKPFEVIGQAFGDDLALLAVETTKLMRVQRQTRAAQTELMHDAKLTGKTAGGFAGNSAVHTETIRKMLMAFSRDLRVVILRLASRLQTLRYFAASKLPVPSSLAQESLKVFAPLANRLGIWQIKWEMEDLAFRFIEPDTYKQVAGFLDEKRTQRENYVTHLRDELEADLAKLGIKAEVQGRPKHIYSIVKKMRGKSLSFEQVLDIRALRVVVHTLNDCYGALSWVHAKFSPIANEFDDYIAKPKANGYQSLHTVVRDADQQAIEIQIRTQSMHDKAEHGAAAHWVYKEAGAKGYAGVSATGSYDAKIAVLRQLIAWERDLTIDEVNAASTMQSGSVANISTDADILNDRIYVLTPEAAVIELAQGSTAIDFAYAIHTSLGHRCRGARLDGVMVPLNTPLQNGQTVEINAAKEGGPSRDWLNPELKFLSSHRAKAKVRAWFNALALQETVARGREAVEKLLQREGKTSIKLADLAVELGFKSADDLFEVVGKDEFSLRTIEAYFKPVVPEQSPEAALLKRAKADSTSKGGVLVVGVDSLLTQLAKCCKPAPGDAIGGFVTRGKGVSIHRVNCTNFVALVARNAAQEEGRVIDVAWSNQKYADLYVYPVDVVIEAVDRQGLLREILEVFSKDKLNVIAAQTNSVKNGQIATAWMTFTVEVPDSARIHKALTAVLDVQGVRSARRS